MAEELPPSPGAMALSAIAPALHVHPAGSPLLRVWFAESRYPSGFGLFRHFGPTGSRFDHHLPGPGGSPASGERGILYVVEECADALTTAIAEVFQDSRTIDLAREAPMMSVFRPRRDLSLLDLTGYWTTKAGASAALSSGRRAHAQSWSRDFYDAYPQIDGLRYRASMSGGGGLAQTLFERSADALPKNAEITIALGDEMLRKEIAKAIDLLGYDLNP